MTTKFAVVVDPLSPAERAELAVIETAIESRVREFAAMGALLARVRDRRLYRDNHATFEEYCRQRWGFSRYTAYDLIQTAEVAGIVEEIPQRPNREQARALAPLRDDPTALREKWSEAHDTFGPQATISQVRQIVRGPIPDPPPRKDMRFAELEDVLSILRNWPDPSAILWPVDERGDVEMVEEALQWLDAWLPKAKASWRAHKALLPKEMRPKGKARRKLRAA